MRRLIPILLLLCFLVIPASAVGSDNSYNELWFNESLTYDEKVSEFKELIGFNYYSAFNKLDALLLTKGESYFDSDRQNVIDGNILFTDLPLYKRIALSNYELYGKYNCTAEQLAIRDLIDVTYQNYFVTAEDIQHDIDNNCIPALNPLPTAITYEIIEPVYSTPQER